MILDNHSKCQTLVLSVPKSSCSPTAFIALSSTMSSETLENVSGNSVYFSELSSSIAFATKSDAPLAVLLEKHEPGVWPLAGDILTLFRNAQFNPNDVTFKRTGDHIDRISQERRALARTRSTCNSQASVSTIPPTVVGLTASHIVFQSRMPLDHPDSSNIEQEGSMGGFLFSIMSAARPP